MKRIFYVFILAIFFSACRKNDHFNSVLRDIVYFQTNDFNGNQNAILAYRMDENGAVAQIPGSPFSTGGSGVGNPQQILGPSDSDLELQITKDGKFLLAVNSGTNNIAVFRIQSDGGLKAVEGSPFPSGGQTPVSIDIKGQYVYIVNKSQDPLRTITEAPNYTVLKMSDNGSLTQVAGSTIATVANASPANALVSRNGKFLFGTDFLAFQSGAGTLRSFEIKNDGKLSPHEPQAIPAMGGALGLWQHPRANVLYVGFPLAAKVGVYNIANDGELKFQTSLAAGPAACWIRANENGDRLYVLNSGENTISMYNSSNAASPSSIGKLTLKNPGPIYMAMGLPFTTSEPFSFEFSTNQQFLFVLNQHTNPDFSVGNYNMLHIVKVEQNGSLSEPGEPIQSPVPNTLRPKGVVVHQVKTLRSSDSGH